MIDSNIKSLVYNTLRDRLVIHEYGRHIQKMIHQAVNTVDAKKRNEMTLAIIDVMGNLNPHLRDVPDFQHKLWDQLFIISNFQLDVDSPFPKMSKETLEERPEPLEYPKSKSKYRYYGKNTIKMIEIASTWKDESTKNILISYIGNHMKKSYLKWNKDMVEDQIILDHMRDLSQGAINIKLGEIELVSSDKLIKMFGVKKNNSYNKKNKSWKQKKRN